MTPAYTDLELASIRYGSVTFTDGRAKWKQLAQTGRVPSGRDKEILELFQQQTGLGGGGGSPDVLYTRHYPYPLHLEIYREIHDPPYLTLISDTLVTALRLAWGIRSNVPHQLTLFDTLA